MEFVYYVNDGIDRLFRYNPVTGQQDRWDNSPGTWANAAPSLVDKIYSGKVGLDEVTAEVAKRGYPRAFGGNPPTVVAAMNAMPVPTAEDTPAEESASGNRAEPDETKEYPERVILTPEMMNKIQVYLSQNCSAEKFIEDYQVAEADQAAVKKFYADLESEMAARALEPGQFWDVSSEWS